MPRDVMTAAPGELAPRRSAERGEDAVIAGFEVGTVALTPELWRRALAERQRLGRVLTGEDLQALGGAMGREDRDA